MMSPRHAAGARILAALAGLLFVPGPREASADRHVYVGSNGTATSAFGASGDLRLSPDGLSLYATRATWDALFVFARDPVSGGLRLVEQRHDLDDPGPVAVSPDSKHLYVGANGSETLGVYARDAGSSALTFIETQNLGAGYGSAVAVSPDGRHVYVGVIAATSSLVVFARDPITGKLTHVETHIDGIGGVDGISFPTAVVVSSDGGDVYAAGRLDEAIAVFRRNPTTGALTYTGMVKNGVGGVTGLAGISGLASSSGGDHLYAGGAGLVVFARDAGTGALTLVESKPDGVGSVAVSSDGSHVYGVYGQRMDVYERNATTGALTFGQRLLNMQRGVVGLDSPTSVAVSSDSRDVYVNGFESVPRFRRIALTCSPAPTVGCFESMEARSGTLVIGDDPNDARDKVDWKWRRREAVPALAVGNPIDPVTDYALCVYDAAGGGRLVTSLLAPAGGGCGRARDGGPTSCWSGNSTPQPTTVNYRRTPRDPDGVSPVSVVSGAAGQPRVKLKARGEYIPALGLPLTPPVTVQLQNAAGECWGNVFSTPTANDAMTFRAMAD